MLFNNVHLLHGTPFISNDRENFFIEAQLKEFNKTCPLHKKPDQQHGFHNKQVPFLFLSSFVFLSFVNPISQWIWSCYPEKEKEPQEDGSNDILFEILNIYISCGQRMIREISWVGKSLGSALFKYCKYTHACTKGVLFRTSMYKMYVHETYCY